MLRGAWTGKGQVQNLTRCADTKAVGPEMAHGNKSNESMN